MTIQQGWNFPAKSRGKSLFRGAFSGRGEKHQRCHDRELGRCFVSVGYCVLQVVVVTEYIRGVTRACGGVNEDVAIEYNV